MPMSMARMDMQGDCGTGAFLQRLRIATFCFFMIRFSSSVIQGSHHASCLHCMTFLLCGYCRLYL